MEDLTKGDSFGKDFDAIEHEFDEIINNNDYVQALKKYNNKGLLARSDVCDALGVTVDGYKDLFIRKIAGNSELIQNIVSNLFIINLLCPNCKILLGTVRVYDMKLRKS